MDPRDFLRRVVVTLWLPQGKAITDKIKPAWQRDSSRAGSMWPTNDGPVACLQKDASGNHCQSCFGDDRLLPEEVRLVAGGCYRIGHERQRKKGL